MCRSGDVRAQLQRILQSKAFRAAEGLRNLLAFIVEEHLGGRGDALKEYLLGVIALGKGASFDPKLDPIVRVQMGRLRQRLKRYYASEGRRDPLVIELCPGTYSPTIHEQQAAADDGDEPPPAERDEWSSFSASDLHLRALYLLGQRSVDGVREAAAVVEDVLHKHPSFAAAYTTLADATGCSRCSR